jgi:hypothetical protein
MARIPRKSYVATREADGTYVIRVTEDLHPAGMIPGFLTMDRALDECARLNSQEDERRRREEPPDV